MSVKIAGVSIEEFLGKNWREIANINQLGNRGQLRIREYLKEKNLSLPKIGEEELAQMKVEEVAHLCKCATGIKPTITGKGLEKIGVKSFSDLENEYNNAIKYFETDDLEALDYKVFKGVNFSKRQLLGMQQIVKLSKIL